MRNKNKIKKGLMQIFKGLISKERINEIARETKFIQRNSGKITSEAFFEMSIFDKKNICKESLEVLCSFLLQKKDIKITSQALDERFNNKSVNFFKTVFEELLLTSTKNTLGINTTFTSNFNRILITDSSNIELPDNCKNMYKGFSGSASESAARLQFTFDIISGNIATVDLNDVTKSDGGYLPILDGIREKKDLAIKDLGYFSIANFDKTNEEGAYYLSRLKVNTAVYILNPNPEKFGTGNMRKSSEYIKLDLVKVAKPLKHNEIKEIEVYIGSNKVKTRLVICKLPTDAVEKKLKNQKKVAHKKQTKISEKSKQMAAVNIYVTNVPAEILPKEIVYLIYSVRWQIEILFKVLKSVFHIDEVKQVKLERIQCHLYSTLIQILLSFKIVFSIRNAIYFYEKKEISELKTFKLVLSFFEVFKDALFNKISDIRTMIEKLIDCTFNNSMKSKNKNKKTVLGILDFEKSL